MDIDMSWIFNYMFPCSPSWAQKTFPFSHTHFLTCEPWNVLAAFSTAETQTPLLPYGRCNNAQPNRCCSCLWRPLVFNCHKREQARSNRKTNQSFWFWTWFMTGLHLIYDHPNPLFFFFFWSFYLYLVYCLVSSRKATLCSWQTLNYIKLSSGWWLKRGLMKRGWITGIYVDHRRHSS